MSILRRITATLPILILALLAGACSAGGEDVAERPAAAVEESAPAEESAPVEETSPEQATSQEAPSADAPSAQAEAPEGYETRSGDGFSVALPPGWEDFDLTQEDLEGIMEEAGSLDEALQAQVRQVAESGLFELFALDPVSAASGFADNANVLCQPGAPDTWDGQEQVVVSSLESSGATEVAVTRMEIDGRDALRVAYLLPSQQSAGVQYNVIGGGEVCSLTVTTNLAAGVEGAVELGEPIGASFRLEG